MSVVQVCPDDPVDPEGEEVGGVGGRQVQHEAVGVNRWRKKK